MAGGSMAGGSMAGDVAVLARPLPPSPPAARLAAPRWRDRKLIIGCLLVLLSVLLGARVLAAADASQQWIAIRADLPAGHVLTSADLTVVKGRLSDGSAGHYLDGAARGRLIGQTLRYPVGAGELLSQSALVVGSSAATRVVPLVVRAGRIPDLQPGALVDVYVLSKAEGADAPAGLEMRVATAVEFLGQQDLGSGAGVAVQVRVPASSAVALVAASQSERVDLVRVDPGSAGQLGDSGPPNTSGLGS
jgi:hypothetical protein